MFGSPSESDMEIYRQLVICAAIRSSPNIKIMRRFFLVLAIAALALVGWLAWGYGREFLAVDSCLDSSGSFDYVTMTCDHTENHPYSPYSQRHPIAPAMAVLAGSAAVCSLVGCRFSRGRSE